MSTAVRTMQRLRATRPAPEVRHLDESVATDTSITPGPSARLGRGIAVIVFALAASAAVHLLVVGRIQHEVAQQRLFDRFRAELASGTAPLGPVDNAGNPLTNGAPVAYLEVPAIGLKQTVVEGTTSANLFAGPGHRRDTALPGQIGTSVLFGRRAMFGGPFSGISKLRSGDPISVTTAQGTFTYRVLGVRHEGDPIPDPPARGGARLTLTTAGGSAFVPAGVVRVDADLVGTAVGGPARLVSAATLPGEEQPMAGDSRTLWALAMWLQALLVVGSGAVWAWYRWGRAQTWVVFVPVLLLVSLFVWGEFARLLPNLA